jgi:GT2 family glycosyltransferase
MNYLGASCAIKCETLKDMLNNDGIEGFNNYDLFFRIFDKYGEDAIGHIPTLLFHSRKNSETNIEQEKEQEIRSLRDHLNRNNINYIINDGFINNTNFIIYQHSDEPLVSIIIPSKDNHTHLQQCVFSILEKTEYTKYEIIIIDNNSTDSKTVSFLKTISVSHPNITVLQYKKFFNYSAINNFAVSEANGEFILLLNDDTIVLQGPWLGRMLQHAQRKDVGAVGARLVYSNQRIQHAGVVLGMYSLAHHPGIGLDVKESGYMNRLQVVQNFSAVTAACLLVKKSRYQEVGGMDEENLKVLFNDVDLCIKLTEAGYRNVWTPHATLIHHGSSSLGRKKSKKEIATTNKRVYQEHKTMKDRWGAILANDPAYNRNLSLQKFNWNIDITTAVPWDITIIERPRFYGVPNNSAGCAFYRVSEPLKHLRKTGFIWDSIYPSLNMDGFTMPSAMNLKRIAPDSILLHGIFCKKDILQDYKSYTNACIIYGLDDLVTRVPKDHPNKSVIPRNVNNLLRNMLEVCDRLIVSTEPLHDQIAKKNMIDDIRVIPNSLPSDYWVDLVSLKRQGKKVRIGWAGALQHHGDLALMEEVVKETYKEVEWVFFGMCFDYLRPYVHEFHPAVDINEYPHKLASLNLDIAVAPLEINAFNEAKSNLRLLEYGILRIPVIATDIFPYQNSPALTLGNDPKLWISAIRERIDQPSAAEKEGEIIRKWVLDNYLLENNAELWLDALAP